MSAALDGEEPGVDPAGVAAHLAGCPDCRAFAEGAAAHHRRLRVRPAEAVPDLTAPILAATAGRLAGPAPGWARYLLGALAAAQLVLAVPAMVGGDLAGAGIHVARELGSFDVALAVGLLWAAWQPRRAAGLLPTAVALAVATAVTAGLDVAQGRAPVVGEAHHVLDVAGLALLWALARPRRRAPAGGSPAARRLAAA